MKDSSIAPIIRRRIVGKLRQIERTEGVRILYACESGSRAWGFPSADSDYDVRFIYIRSRSWYLSIDTGEKPDTLEYPLDKNIDIAGWDLSKALGLLYKSNPALIEWFRSPIVYVTRPRVAALRRLAAHYFSPLSGAWHYLNMARANARAYLQGSQVVPKKYFYVLRPLLAVRWLEAARKPVPMEFNRLVDRTLKPGKLQEKINELIVSKRQGRELDKGPRIPLIHEFIEKELIRLQNPSFPNDGQKRPLKRLNDFFRNCI